MDNSYAALPSDLKRNNRQQILEFFRSGNSYTIREISDQLHLSRQTVSKAIQFFIDKGLIITAGKGNSTNVGGKRSVIYSLTQDRFLLTVSIWPNGLHMSLLNLCCEIIDQYRDFSDPMESAESTMQTIGGLAARLLQKNGIQMEQLYAVSLSISGVVNYKTKVLKFDTFLPEWGYDIDVESLLRPYFDAHTPIFIDNACKVISRSFLHGKDTAPKRSLVLLTAWDGIGGCFIENDRILYGKNSMIGEIGHMVIDPGDSETCICGEHGCLERLISMKRIRRSINAAARKGMRSSLLTIPEDALTVQDVFYASGNGDELARSLVSELARILSVALHNISVTFSPEKVILLGDYAAADDWFREELMRNLSIFRYMPADAFSLVQDNRSIEQLNILGSYTMMLDALFNDETLYS